MKVKALVCRLDGTQETVEREIPDEWAASLATPEPEQSAEEHAVEN